MLIDRSHRPWFQFTVVALVISSVVYAIYSWKSVRGPNGGSTVGLIFGILGYGLMVFAGLLSVRKRYPIWRIGKATNWMRGHLWLGFLSFPLILFHAAFSFGAGALTKTLMALLIVVIVSGLFGAGLQHFVPRMMTERVQMETIYEQIDSVRSQILQEAENIAAELISALGGDLTFAGEAQRAAAASAGTRGGLTFGAELGADDEIGSALMDFFKSEVRPYLQNPDGKSPLQNKTQAVGMFAQLRAQLPRRLWPKLADLENICEEKRGLDRQRRMHEVLHGWLLVHVPISYALLLLSAVHAVAALRY